MEPLPFHINNVHGGFSSSSGLLHLVNGGLRLEYRTDIGGLGVKSKSKEATILFDEISLIEFKKGWFGARARLFPNHLKTLDKLPATEDHSAILRFRRGDRNRAEYFISEVNLRLSQHRLAAIDQEADITI